MVLGVGCRRGTPREVLETAFRELCEEQNLWPEAVCGAATIDLKAEEAGLLDFCAAHGWPLTCYSAEELRRAEGTFTPSAFVKVLISPISAPATKDLVPAPVKIKHLTSSRFTASRVVFNSSSTWEFRAFNAFSRLMVIIPVWPFCSYKI